MPIVTEIETRLRAAFAPTVLDVVDESEKHRGHAGHTEAGESHFQVSITAAAFGPMTRIARHRAIHAAIGPDIMGRIHALGIDVRAQ